MNSRLSIPRLSASLFAVAAAAFTFAPLALSAPCPEAPAELLPSRADEGEGSSQEAREEAISEILSHLADARNAHAAGEHDLARERVSAAIELALPVLARHEEPEHLCLCAVGHFAHEVGELSGARRFREALVEMSERTLPEDHPETLTAQAGLAVTLSRLGDLAGARRLFEAVLDARERTLPADHPQLLSARQNLAVTTRELGDLTGARALFEAVLEARERSLPGDHAAVLAARSNLAVTMKELGDLAGARVLEEAVLEVLERTLPEDHAELLAARSNLAITMKELGDLAGARVLEEAVLEARERSLPEGDPRLVAARQNLAVTRFQLGELDGARALFEEVLEARERMYPEDHPQLLAARQNLAVVLQHYGDLAGARELEEAVLEAKERTLPAGHPELLTARNNLAVTTREIGDLGAARSLFESLLEDQERSLSDDHPDLQRTRQNLALTLKDLGDLPGARALEEGVLEIRERTLSADHPDLLDARQNLAGTLLQLGDLAFARVHFEAVLEARERAYPADHPELLSARSNLALTLMELGEAAVARGLFDAVLEARERSYPEDHPLLLLARQNLAAAESKLGNFTAARLLDEAVLEAQERTLPASHPDLLRSRQNLAVSLRRLGDLAGAREHLEAVLEARKETLPEGHPELLGTLHNLTSTIESQCALLLEGRGEQGEGEEEEQWRGRLVELHRELSRARVSATREAVLAGSAREAEERAMGVLGDLGAVLSAAQGVGAVEAFEELVEDAFLLSEATRGTTLAVATLMRGANATPEQEDLRAALRRAGAELADLAQRGTSREEYHRVRAQREELERRLTLLAREQGSLAEGWLELDLQTLGARIGEREALVAFRRHPRWTVEVVDGEPGSDASRVSWSVIDHLCAFVLRRAVEIGSARLALLDLGPIAAIDEAVRDWRAGIGAGDASLARSGGGGDRELRGIGIGDGDRGDAHERAEHMRRLVWDPLLPALAQTERVILVLDDVLHLVPIDALPLEGGAELVGDRMRIETRIALWELMGEHEPPATSGGLLAVGGAAFHAEPALHGEEGEPEPVQLAAATIGTASLLRGGAWEGGFAPLASTGPEARGIAELFLQVGLADADAIVLAERGASRPALAALAGGARWLHVATHGWFAPESVRSWNDLDADESPGRLPLRAGAEDVVRGMSPMLLCGLALAGANLPPDSLGRVPGLMTAEELSTLDLTSCELAVLSACDTNVGERRAGQGVASLQKALHMAGARSVITSLWKVPDEATAELMLDFYRRLWVEGKPKHQALWEAKERLRHAKDERGEPLYTVRDWAAWVLTGDPD